MKIPTADSLGYNVGPSAGHMPNRSVPTGSGLDSVVRGFSEIGAAGGMAISTVAKEYRREQEKEAEKLAAKEATDLATEYQRYDTDRWSGTTKQPEATGYQSFDPEKEYGPESNTGIPDLLKRQDAEAVPGFSSTRGEAAMNGMDPYLEDLDKKRKELAGKARSPRAKELFEHASQGTYQRSYDRAHGHTAQQIEQSKASTLKAGLAETQRAVSAEPEDDELADRLVGQNAGSAWAMRDNDADGENKTKEIQAKVAETRAKALMAAALDSPDLDRADAMLQKSESILKAAPLGEEARSLFGEVQKQQALIAQKRELYAVEKTSSDIVAGASDPNTGWYDAKKAKELLAKELLAKTEVSDASRKAFNERLEHKTLKALQENDRIIDGNADVALSAYLKGGHTLAAVPVQTKQWLQDYAPKKWDEMEQKQARDSARARARLRGEHGDKETRSEIEAMGEFEADLAQNPGAYRDMNSEQFNSKWGGRLSDSGLKRAQSLFAGNLKGDQVNDKAYGDYVKDQVKSNPMFQPHAGDSKEAKATRKRLANGYAADFGEAKRSFKEKNKRDPTMAEVKSDEFKKDIYLNMLRRSGMKVEVDEGEALVGDALEEAPPQKDPETPPIPSKDAKPVKAKIVGPDGKPAMANEAGLDAWLKAHPGWKRAPGG